MDHLPFFFRPLPLKHSAADWSTIVYEESCGPSCGPRFGPASSFCFFPVENLSSISGCFFPKIPKLAPRDIVPHPYDSHSPGPDAPGLVFTNGCCRAGRSLFCALPFCHNSSWPLADGFVSRMGIFSPRAPCFFFYLTGVRYLLLAVVLFLEGSFLRYRTCFLFWVDSHAGPLDVLFRAFSEDRVAFSVPLS